MCEFLITLWQGAMLIMALYQLYHNSLLFRDALSPIIHRLQEKVLRNFIDWADRFLYALTELYTDL